MHLKQIEPPVDLRPLLRGQEKKWRYASVSGSILYYCNEVVLKVHMWRGTTFDYNEHLDFLGSLEFQNEGLSRSGPELARKESDLSFGTP